MTSSILNRIKKIIYNVENIEKIIKNELEISNIKTLSLNSKSLGITSDKHCTDNIVVSLTTHKNRIFSVHLAIESLMQQYVKPNNIVLWLSKNHFSKDNIPYSLKSYEKRGLTINFTEDVKSYTKLIPTLKYYPNDIIITVDDDVIYEPDMIGNLLQGYLKNPTCIQYCRGHRMVLDKKNNIKPYRDWYHGAENIDSSVLNFPTGVGGVLYPSHSLSKEVLSVDTFSKICPTADDIWFKAMSLLNGTICRKVNTKKRNGEDYAILTDLQATGLQSINIGRNRNDEQIKAVFEKYDLVKRLIQ